MHLEYGDLDCDYVFVNLWGGQVGTALRYASVADLVGRLRRRTGIGFHLHQMRHTHATELLRGGVRIEVASKRLTHASTQTTESFYDHLTVEDTRPAIDAFWAARDGAR
jgi:integrase